VLQKKQNIWNECIKDGLTKALHDPRTHIIIPKVGMHVKEVPTSPLITTTAFVATQHLWTCNARSGKPKGLLIFESAALN
jgi:hypothetical protein